MLSAIHVYRLSRWFHLKRVPIVPRLLDYVSRVVFACWVPHRADLGQGVVLGYGGLGVVIHDESVVGAGTHIDQGVTIGGNARESGVARIGRDVYIGAGAVVLGPIVVGDGAVIGANAVVTTDVPPRTVFVGVPARIIKSDIKVDDYLYHRRST
jgi:serine O-acetyltransferase